METMAPEQLGQVGGLWKWKDGKHYAPEELGQVGCNDGKVRCGPSTRWDDGRHCAVKEILLYYSNDRINGIQVKYDDGWKPLHGSNACTHSEHIILNSDEKLNKLSGYTEGDILRSIKFVSNKNSYGPYGQAIGQAFEDDGEIVGFRGKVGDCGDLASLRAHIKGC